MKRTMWIAGILVLGLSLVTLDFTGAQCGGGCCKPGGGCHKDKGRCDSVQTRLKPDWSCSTKPMDAASQNRADPFAAIQEIQEAAKKGHLSLLYLYDSRKGEEVLTFEDNLFRDEKLAVASRVFRCVRLDVAKNEAAQERLGNKVPCFLTYNARGERDQEVSMAGHKPNTDALLKAMSRTARGHGKLPLLSFVKKYGEFLRNLDRLDARKKTCAERKARVQDRPKKLKKVEAEEAQLASEEKALLDLEKKLLTAVKAYGFVPAVEKKPAVADARS
jgi:hypothetical protein